MWVREILKGKELLSAYYHAPIEPVHDAEVSFQVPLVNPATFAYLIVPALAGFAWGTRWGVRLWLGWGLSVCVSLAGMVTSAVFDLPTGALIVCVFGVALATISGGTALMATARPT